MARYVDAVDLALSPGGAFDYLADLSRTAEWDPGGLERPTRLLLEGGDASLRSIDEITFLERPSGTRVTYEARLELSGIRRLADPLLDLLFQRIGRVAMRGLRERLQGEGPTTTPGAPGSDGTRPARAKAARRKGRNERRKHAS